MATERLATVREKLKRGDCLTLDFIGDSITWGLNHCTPEETFVAFFARRFATAFPHYRVTRYDGIAESEALPISHFDGPFSVGGEGNLPEITVVRNGVGGNTVRRAIRRKENFLGKMPNGKHADLAFLMFGINDALSSDRDKFVSPERFEADYEELLALLLREPDLLPLLITPTYNGVNYPLGDYADVVRHTAARHSLPLLDAHALWTAHYSPSAPRFGQGSWLSESKSDACHFSPEGAAATADFLFDGFLRLLTE